MSEYTKYAEQYHTYMTMTEATLGKLMPIDNALQHNVNDAMSYSLLGGGKRLRGVLVLAFNKLCGGSVDDALPLACAAEMVHAYSLIHDDLPCMDNDELRRGKPTCHIRYGEAIALLAGDGLLTKAFETICAAQGLSDNCKSRAVLMLSSAAGTQGMIGGQVIDIESEGKTVSQQTLDKLHSLKTGALIRGAVAMGCLSANADAFTTECSDRFAEKLGLIFQIVDDILDITASAEELGKSVGSDAENKKTTYATLFGVEKSQDIVSLLASQAKAEITKLDADCNFLCDLIDNMAVRTN